MNYPCDVNDRMNWSPTDFTGCDTGGFINSYSGTVRANLSAEYFLREGSGTIAHDNSGNELHATFISGYEPVWATLGLQFDEGNLADGVQMPNSVLGVDHTSVVGFSIEFWVRVDPGSDGGYFASFSNLGIQLLQRAGGTPGTTQIEAWIHGETVDTEIVDLVSGSWSAEEWEQVVVVRSNDGSTVSVYLNGVSDSSRSVTNNVPVGLDVIPGSLLISAGPKVIGANMPQFNNPSFTGTMGEMRIYSTELTPAQILANFNARKGLYGL